MKIIKTGFTGCPDQGPHTVIVFTVYEMESFMSVHEPGVSSMRFGFRRTSGLFVVPLFIYLFIYFTTHKEIKTIIAIDPFRCGSRSFFDYVLLC